MRGREVDPGGPKSTVLDPRKVWTVSGCGEPPKVGRLRTTETDSVGKETSRSSEGGLRTIRAELKWGEGGRVPHLRTGATPSTMSGAGRGRSGSGDPLLRVEVKKSLGVVGRPTGGRGGRGSSGVFEPHSPRLISKQLPYTFFCNLT